MTTEANTGITPAERVTEAAQRITPELVAELPAELLTRAAATMRHAAAVLSSEASRQGGGHAVGVDDARLIEGVVRNARRSAACAITWRGTPTWAVVRDICAVGSTTARALCRRFGVDPDAKVEVPCG